MFAVVSSRPDLDPISSLKVLCSMNLVLHIYLLANAFVNDDLGILRSELLARFRIDLAP
jgi:hypothetical protein